MSLRLWHSRQEPANDNKRTAAAAIQGMADQSPKPLKPSTGDPKLRLRETKSRGLQHAGSCKWIPACCAADEAHLQIVLGYGEYYLQGFSGFLGSCSSPHGRDFFQLANICAMLALVALASCRRRLLSRCCGGWWTETATGVQNSSG